MNVLDFPPARQNSLCLDDFLEKSRTHITDRLNTLTQFDPLCPYASLFEATRYSLLSTGKRMRPQLLLATLHLYDMPLEQGMDAACAIEMIHTYSLIHDDLPCMDNDDFRRGKPTLHLAFSESTALLAGDFLLTYAFEVICQSDSLSAEQKVALIATFSHNAGAHGMIGGQVIDLASESMQISAATLEQMHEGKTAKLIIAALVAGAIIANAPTTDRDLLTLIGKKIGIAFQIADDILDVTGQFEQMGKLAGADAKKNKATAVSILGLGPSQALMKQLHVETQQIIQQLSRPAPLLSALINNLIHREH